MSSFTFTSSDRTARVAGSERPYGAILAARLTAAALDLDVEGVARKVLPRAFFQHMAFREANNSVAPGSYSAAFVRWVPLAEMLNSNVRLTVGERSVPPSELVLNTAIVFGSAAVALLARIHGSGEDGLLVDGPHRAWLAGIIDDGVATGILRDSEGWERAAQLLRADDTSPVLIAAADVSELQGRAVGAFVRSVPADEKADDARQEAWDNMADAQRWAQSIDAIEAARTPDKQWWLMLAPEAFQQPCYGSGTTAFSANVPEYA